jgi:hypothetical protein
MEVSWERESADTADTRADGIKVAHMGLRQRDLTSLLTFPAIGHARGVGHYLIMHDCTPSDP